MIRLRFAKDDQILISRRELQRILTQTGEETYHEFAEVGEDQKITTFRLRLNKLMGMMLSAYGTKALNAIMEKEKHS